MTKNTDKKTNGKETRLLGDGFVLTYNNTRYHVELQPVFDMLMIAMRKLPGGEPEPSRQ